MSCRNSSGILRYKQTDHFISARQPDIIIINEKKDNLQNDGLH